MPSEEIVWYDIAAIQAFQRIFHALGVESPIPSSAEGWNALAAAVEALTMTAEREEMQEWKRRATAAEAQLAEIRTLVLVDKW